MTGKLTGGLVNYYLAPVTHPQRKEQAPYVAECEDIAEALQLTPNEFCEFKAIWRTAAARQGNGKPDQKALYDAEKRLHYAGRDVAKYKRELEDSTKIEPGAFDEILPNKWYQHTTTSMPHGLQGIDLVMVKTKALPTKPNGPLAAKEWDWYKTDHGDDIEYFMLVQKG